MVKRPSGVDEADVLTTVASAVPARLEISEMTYDFKIILNKLGSISIFTNNCKVTEQLKLLHCRVAF
jgi:hypothetical protein